MINLTCASQCSGCSACAAVCPVSCIQMMPDAEGFLYPTIDESSCIQCGKCDQVCPILNQAPEITKQQSAFLAQYSDPAVRMESTSGGVFTAIATAVLQHKNAAVYGAAYNDSFHVCHQAATSLPDLAKFRNSKYVQSNMRNSYREIKRRLNEGQLVCFSGTPCQIEGLLHFLGKDYPNLICVDVVCRAVPSPLILEKYLHWHSQITGSAVLSLRFRDKRRYGYRYSQMYVQYQDADIDDYARGIESDPYLRAFFSGTSVRPSCYACVFRRRYRKSDITIWDAQDCGRFSKELDDNQGTNKVLIHSQKGRDIWNAASQWLHTVEEVPERLIAGVTEFTRSPHMPDQRADFFRDAAYMDPEQLFAQYFPNSLKSRFQRTIKALLSRSRLYDYVKKAVKHG